jgi:hypothetical protein
MARSRIGLDIKYKRFCEHYVNNGANAVEAWHAVGSKAKNSSISANIRNVLNKPKVIAYLEELNNEKIQKIRAIAADNDITKDNLIKKLYIIASDDKASNRDKISAIDKIADILGLKATKDKNTIEVSFTKDMEAVERLTKEIKERERSY